MQTTEQQLARITALVEDAKAKSRAKQAAKQQHKEAPVSQQSTEERIQIVQAWEAWSKSKSHYAGLKQTEHNFNVLGEALLPIQNLSIAAIDEAVHRLTKEGRLEYVQQAERIVYRDRPAPVLTDAQRARQHTDNLLKLAPQAVRTEFDREQAKEDAAKATPMTREEMDRRAINHYKDEAQTILDLISGYSYPRSKAVEQFRKNKLRQIEARDPDGFLNLIVMLELTHQMIAGFSSEPGPEHDRAVAEARVGIKSIRPTIVSEW
jgi:hypothetical protein